MSGIKCPPATHTYRALGKIAFCKRCADVQPLLLDVSRQTLPYTGAPPFVDLPETDDEPSAEDVEAHIARIRELAGLSGGERNSANTIHEVDAALDDALGQRRTYEGEYADEALIADAPRTFPEVVDHNDDRLPDPGL